MKRSLDIDKENDIKLPLHILQKRRKGKVLLYEFIMSLLNDGNYRGVISWLSPDQADWNGSFVINDPEILAQMWGNINQNPAMTYDKISRGLRHYYTRDLLVKLDGRYQYRWNMSAVNQLLYSKTGYRYSREPMASADNTIRLGLSNNLWSFQPIAFSFAQQTPILPQIQWTFPVNNPIPIMLNNPNFPFIQYPNNDTQLINEQMTDVKNVLPAQLFANYQPNNDDVTNNN